MSGPFHIAMAAYDALYAVMKRTGHAITGDQLEVTGVAYEAGAEMVLREAARNHLLRHALGGFGYEKHDAKDNEFLELLKTIESKTPKLKKEIEELESLHNATVLDAMDAAFIQGFIAGYRFLKELNPE